MRVGTQSFALPFNFGAKIIELLLAQSSFHEGAGINPRGGMPLEVHQIATKILAGGPKEMIEANVIERRGGGKARNVPAEFGGLAIGPHHHCHSVPAYERTNPVLNRGIARKSGLHVGRNRIDVGGIGGVREVGTRPTGLIDQALDEVMGSFYPFGANDRLECFQPLAGLFRIGVLGKMNVLG